MTTTVDRNFEAAPKAAQAKLKELRRISKSVAPGASEGMSY